jgi:hypothetical protein
MLKENTYAFKRISIRDEEKAIKPPAQTFHHSHPYRSQDILVILV